MELVTRARAEYQKAPRTTFVEAELRELDRWLTARR